MHALRTGAAGGPLALGNLKAQRDWGFAPDYVDGMVDDPPPGRRPRRAGRGASPTATTSSAPGRLHSVWELADRAFALAGFELEWQLDGDDPLAWSARFAGSGEPAVVVDPAFIRPSDPKAIAADPRRIEAELGWEPKPRARPLPRGHARGRRAG